MNLEILEKYVKDGKLRKSEDKELVQYNYSDYVTDDFWDDVTMNNRGHIYEKSSGKLVARTFEKFFNFHELSLSKQKELLKNDNFTVSKKYDGCLGIIYKYNNTLRYNSRGSFDNYVVKAIDRIIKAKKIKEKLFELPYNLVVEVIAPETRIVVNYDFEDKTDKELGLYFKDNMSIYAPIIFNMRKGKSIENELIKLVKPINDL